MAMTTTATRVGPRVITLAGVAMCLDWVSKVVATNTLEDGPVHVGSLITLRLTRNSGMAFSLGDSLPGPLLIAATAALTVVLAVMAVRGLLGPWWAAGLLLGAAAANLGDRILGGSVVDFLDLEWWPSFNLADVYLTVGCGLLLVSSLVASADEPAS